MSEQPAGRDRLRELPDPESRGDRDETGRGPRRGRKVLDHNGFRVFNRRRLADTGIDALCDAPESVQLYGIVAHVLTYSAHRRGLARAMLARHGIETDQGDPLEWMRRD